MISSNDAINSWGVGVGNAKTSRAVSGLVELTAVVRCVPPWPSELAKSIPTRFVRPNYSNS